MMTIVSLLFNSLWESVVVLLVAALALRIARNSNATTRYAVWTAALVCSVVLPVLTTVAMSRIAAHVAAPISTIFTAVRTPHTFKVPASALAHAAAAQTDMSPPAIRRAQFTIAPLVVLVVAALWGLVALFNSIRFAMSVAVLERLKKNATPLPVEYRNRLSRWQAMMSASHRVRLCLSDEISVPVAVGIFDAMILLPVSLVDELEADDIDRIVLHEYAHLSRGDDWINAFERIALAVFFFNPAIRYIARQMDIEREVSCDDSVVVNAGDALPLATCLVKMVEKVSWPYEPLAAPGVFDTRRNLSLRVERLLMFARDRRTRISAAPTLGAVAAMFALVLIGTLVSPMFVAALPESKPLRIAATPARVQIHPHAKSAPKVQHAKTRSTTLPKSLAPRESLPTKNASPSFIPEQPKFPAVTLPRKRAPRSDLPMKSPILDKVKIPQPLAVAVNPTPRPRPTCQCAPRSNATGQAGDYINELASVGYKNLTVEELVQLKDMGVTADYIRSLQAAGYSNLTTRELIEARGSNLSVDYIRAMHTRFGTLSLRQVSELSALGVTTEYIDQLAAAGYRGLTAREIQELRALGVDQTFINNANAHGFHNLTVQQLIRLKASGVL